MPDLTLQEIERIEALERAATAGPWEVLDRNGLLVAGPVKPNGKRNKVAVFPVMTPEAEKAADAALIAAIRNAAPSLLALARRALGDTGATGGANGSR